MIKINRPYKFTFWKSMIVLLYLLNSCCTNENDQYNYIPDENKLKYKVDDTLVYMSNNGLYDTMIVFKINQTFDYIEMYDFCGTRTYKEMLIYYLKSTLNSDTNFIQLNYKDEFFLSWENISFSNRNPSRYKFYEELLINNILYKDVYEINPSLIYIDTLKLYYNPINGCIKYIYKNGDAWLLVNQ
jgi:hypothetical protein